MLSDSVEKHPPSLVFLVYALVNYPLLVQHDIPTLLFGDNKIGLSIDASPKRTYIQIHIPPVYGHSPLSAIISHLIRNAITLVDDYLKMGLDTYAGSANACEGRYASLTST